MAVELTAYQYQSDEGWVIEPAKAHRDWMHETIGKAALRCLPLSIVNQAGWIIRSPATFKARWTARKPEPSSLVVTFPDKKDERYADVIKTNFGSGIITIAFPWLFRTSEGIGMWVHGPPNWPKSDVVPLEGLVETDWSPAPFTMNWKILKPKIDVWFKKGDPLCMITPYPIGLLEDFKPVIKPITADPELHKQFVKVARSRVEANRRGDPGEGKFELKYMRGQLPEGLSTDRHWSSLKLAAFREDGSSP